MSMDSETIPRNPRFLPLLGIAVVIGSTILSWGIYASRAQEDTLSVTGSAKRAVTADTAKWQGNFSRSVMVENLKEGYLQMAQDQKAVEQFLSSHGVENKDTTISSVFMEQLYDPNGGPPRQYILRQNVQVTSSDLQKITDLSKNIQPLIDQGIIYSSYPVEYYYSNLTQLRIELLADAVKDAQQRGSAIAGSTGKRLGSLSSASMGVVQVLAPNSIDVSDYGSYDTSSIEKDVMVTVRTVFRIQ